MIAARALRPSLGGAFRGEVLKVSRQLSVWLMLGAAFVLLAVIVLASTTAPTFRADLDRSPSAFLNDVTLIYGNVFQIGSGIFLLIVSARLFAMEYSSGVIRVLYARGLGRLQLLAVKAAALVALGWIVLGGYVVIVAVIVAGYVQAWQGSLAPLGQVAGWEWQNVERALVFYAANMVVLVVVGAATAALGRSLAFALPAALAVFPADNFGSIILALLYRVTGHAHPWLDINQWFLGPNLNNVLSLWESTHPRAPFATPTATVDLTHTVVVIAGWTAGMGAIAVIRTVRPDVLE